MNWAYNPAIHAPTTIAAVANAFTESLRRIIYHCQHSEGGFTPSDFDLING